MAKNKLNTKALALSLGIISAVSVFLIGIFNLSFGLWPTTIKLIMEVYPGFDISIVGILIGAFWGFIDGFIGGILIAWLYNKFSK